ncbi:ATP-binding protein [Plantactinospora sonchi]|uniref:ATP-binding protein n=1 Tax=Plantactinospora sonchi TaxID=1544735 RepID=A0ABU7RKU0_9ACTN
MNDSDPLSPAVSAPTRSTQLLVQTFDRDRVTEVRHTVAQHAEAVGLGGERLDDFVLAVNELITNAVRHGGGRGGLRLWFAEGVLHCVVSDTGTGITGDRLDEHARPEPETAGGWGLWLARQLSDEMLVRSGADGTTVRISARVDTVAPELDVRQLGEVIGRPEEVTGAN